MALFNDTAVSQWTTTLPTSSAAYRWLRQQMAHKNSISLAILLRHTTHLIGWICSEPEHRTFIITPLQVVEGEMALRYALARPHWGHGYMTEAVQAIIAYTFTTLHAPQVTADCAQENIASRRVMEKAGMIYAGLEQYYTQDMSLLSNHRYVLPRAHWQAQAHTKSGGV
jgi:RimJ/RimL family protein N-acetyltransferase